MLDGAASVMVGIAANESMRTGRIVTVKDLFDLDAHRTPTDTQKKD